LKRWRQKTLVSRHLLRNPRSHWRLQTPRRLSRLVLVLLVLPVLLVLVLLVLRVLRVLLT
jgi:hypothetical protein